MKSAKYGRCDACGKPAEKTPSGVVHQGHNVGCKNARPAPAAEPAAKKAAAKRTAKRSQ